MKRTGPLLSLTLLLTAVRLEAAPTAGQLDAPSINSASPDLLDQAESAEHAGLAWNERIGEMENRRAMTLSLTPLQRAALRLTLGGPPQFIDSLRTVGAGRARDHVTSELKLRLLNQRETILALALDADNLGTGYGL